MSKKATTPLWLLGAVLLAVSSPEAAEIHKGDILVALQAGGTGASGALLLVNPVTGQRSMISDFGNPAQGPLGGGDLAAVAVGPNNEIFVSSLFSGLFQVDPQTGNRTLVPFGQPPLTGVLYYGLAVAPERGDDDKSSDHRTNDILANLNESTSPFSFVVIRIDPDTHQTTLVTDLSNPAQGETGALITDLSVEPSGAILIGVELTFSGPAAIFRVDPATGQRTLVSDFSNPAQGTDVVDLYYTDGIKWSQGRIFATSNGPSTTRNLLLSIDPQTGNRTVLSDFDNPAQGPTAFNVGGTSVEKSGNIIVIGFIQPTGNALFRVNGRTGERVVLSPNDPAHGPLLIGPVYVAIVP